MIFKGYIPRLRTIFKVMKIYIKTDVRKTDVDVFLIANLGLVRRFELDGMRLFSKPGAIMQPFLKLSYHSRVHLIKNWLCQFFQMGYLKKLKKLIF